jgi:hypothetical protein
MAQVPHQTSTATKAASFSRRLRRSIASGGTSSALRPSSLSTDAGLDKKTRVAGIGARGLSAEPDLSLLPMCRLAQLPDAMGCNGSLSSLFGFLERSAEGGTMTATLVPAAIASPIGRSGACPCL